MQGSHSDWKTWKTWKNGKAFSSQGKVREFWWDWKSQGKVRENHIKYWKTGNFRQMLFVIFQWQLNEFVYYLLNLIKFSVKKTITEKILENGEKYWKSQGKVREFCQSGKVGTLICTLCLRRIVFFVLERSRAFILIIKIYIKWNRKL